MSVGNRSLGAESYKFDWLMFQLCKNSNVFFFDIARSRHVMRLSIIEKSFSHIKNNMFVESLC